MKRGFIALILLISLFSIGGVFAKCVLQASMINQDPYPALQGDYVKIVFQLDGVQNPECGRVEFELVEKYPISLDPSQTALVTVDAGTYAKDFSSFLLVPYKVRVDGAAIDGDNPIEVKYRYGGNTAYETQQFDLNVRDTRVDFEVHVENYDSLTKVITFEILNIGKSDIEALSVEIPKQDNIEIKGSNKNIVGDLDSNEYATADFEAALKDGEVTLKITYTDSINVRRTITEKVTYESDYFNGRATESENSGSTKYILIGAAILIVAYFFYRKHKKKQAREKKLHSH